MYFEKVSEFYQTLVNSEHFNEELKNKLQRIHDEKEYKVFIQNELIPLAKSMGYDLSMDDILDYEHKKLQRLSDEDLESVTGGIGLVKNLSLTFISALAIAGGVYAVQSMNSAQAMGPGQGTSAQAPAEQKENADLKKAIDASLQEQQARLYDSFNKKITEAKTVEQLLSLARQILGNSSLLPTSKDILLDTISTKIETKIKTIAEDQKANIVKDIRDSALSAKSKQTLLELLRATTAAVSSSTTAASSTTSSRGSKPAPGATASKVVTAKSAPAAETTTDIVETPDHKLTEYGYEFISKLISSTKASRPGEAPLGMLNWALGKRQEVHKPNWTAKDYATYFAICFDRNLRGLQNDKGQVKALEDKFGFKCPDAKNDLSDPQFARFKGDIAYAMKYFSASAVETPDHKLTEYGYKFISELISSTKATRPGEAPIGMLNWALGKRQEVHKPNWTAKDYATYFAICFDRNLRGLQNYNGQVKALEDKFGFKCPDSTNPLTNKQFDPIRGDIEYATERFSAPAVETSDHKLTEYGYEFISKLINSTKASRPGEAPLGMLNWALGKKQEVHKPNWTAKDYATYFAICFDRNLRGLQNDKGQVKALEDKFGFKCPDATNPLTNKQFERIRGDIEYATKHFSATSAAKQPTPASNPAAHVSTSFTVTTSTGPELNPKGQALITMFDEFLKQKETIDTVKRGPKTDQQTDLLRRLNAQQIETCINILKQFRIADLEKIFAKDTPTQKIFLEAWSKFYQNRKSDFDKIKSQLLHRSFTLAEIISFAIQTEDISKLKDLRTNLDQNNSERIDSRIAYLGKVSECANIEIDYDVPKDPPRFVGIRNVGNSCYLNAAIQALVHNTDFRQHMRDFKARGLRSQETRVRAVYKLLLQIFNALDNPPSPPPGAKQEPVDIEAYVNNIRSIVFPNTLLTRQQDASDFLSAIMNNIEYKPTPVTVIKTGKNGSITQETNDEYLLTLNIPQIAENQYATESTFDTLLENHFAEDTSAVSTDVKSTRQTLQSAPRNLNFLIVRTGFNKTTVEDFRINAKIPLLDQITLDRKYFTRPDAVPIKYQLKAVVCHHFDKEDTSSGHYTSYIKDSTGTWYHCNDSSLNKVINLEDMKKACLETAYILTYERVLQFPSTPSIPGATRQPWSPYSVPSTYTAPASQPVSQSANPSQPYSQPTLQTGTSSPYSTTTGQPFAATPVPTATTSAVYNTPNATDLSSVEISRGKIKNIPEHAGFKPDFGIRMSNLQHCYDHNPDRLKKEVKNTVADLSPAKVVDTVPIGAPPTTSATPRVVLACNPNGTFIPGQDLMQRFSRYYNLIMTASQFNLLESTTRKHALLYAYAGDQTQGPTVCSLSILGCLKRESQYEDRNLGDLLSDRIRTQFSSVYQNGYLEPWRLNEKQAEYLARALSEPSSVRYGYQDVVADKQRTPDAEKPFRQIFCSAVSYQGTTHNGFHKPAISYLALRNQYMNALKDAINTSRQNPTQDIALHITWVGGGAFANLPGTAQLAFLNAYNQLKGRIGKNLTIFLHGNRSDWNYEQIQTSKEKIIDDLLQIKLNSFATELLDINPASLKLST